MTKVEKNIIMSQFSYLFKNEQYEKAKEVLESFVPKHLYKFYSFGSEEKKSQKLATLRNGEIWAASPKENNDPFEINGGGVYINCDRLSLAMQEINCPPEKIEYIIHMIKAEIEKRDKEAFIASFIGGPFACDLDIIMDTKSLIPTIPMWAYYAEDNKGFCIKFNAECAKKTGIYSVEYSAEQSELYTEIIRGLTREGFDERLDFIYNLRYVFKSSQWEHEHEYRYICYLSQHPELAERYNKKANGLSVTFGELGIKPEKIYLGVNCEEENKNEMIEIAKIIGAISVSQLYVKADVLKFEYGEKELWHA